MNLMQIDENHFLDNDTCPSWHLEEEKLLRIIESGLLKNISHRVLNDPSVVIETWNRRGKEIVEAECIVVGETDVVRAAVESELKAERAPGRNSKDYLRRFGEVVVRVFPGCSASVDEDFIEHIRNFCRNIERRRDVPAHRLAIPYSSHVGIAGPISFEDAESSLRFSLASMRAYEEMQRMGLGLDAGADIEERSRYHIDRAHELKSEMSVTAEDVWSYIFNRRHGSLASFFYNTSVLAEAYTGLMGGVARN